MTDRIPTFGRISAQRTPPRKRDGFRIAVFGDFSGRSANGVIETGAALAARRAVKLDVDTIDQVIEDFATTLVLPVGNDGTGLEIKLNRLDDLHPDQIFDCVEMFQALSGLKEQLATGTIPEKTLAELQSWSEAYGTKVNLPKKSAANAVPADRRLSDFQALIGDTTVRQGAKTEVDELIGRIVGPHIVAAPDQGVEAMQAAVDDALSNAMRLVLHHPSFQAIEAQWRSLDLLARNIESDENLEVVVYDVSAEEIAKDLAASEELDTSGLFRLLNDAASTGGGLEANADGYSAIIGLYTFEETPPHAELLGRISKIAAFVDAPFFTAISPAFQDVPLADRHPLVSNAWNRLRVQPEANYLGIASPRFMLRRPYGSKSDPVSAFKYEEFSKTEGLSGLSWANPSVLVAILLARTFTNDAWDMSLGSVMLLGDVPFHLMNDRYGDQIALPCTERNLSDRELGLYAERGIMPVLSIKGRDQIRLASFHAVGGQTVFGPWSGPERLDALESKSHEPEFTATLQLVVDAQRTEQELQAAVSKPETSDEDENDASMDNLLASFGENGHDENDADENDEMDAELAALLEGL